MQSQAVRASERNVSGVSGSSASQGHLKLRLGCGGSARRQRRLARRTVGCQARDEQTKKAGQTSAVLMELLEGLETQRNSANAIAEGNEVITS